MAEENEAREKTLAGEEALSSPMHLKAEKFGKFLKENDIKVFSKEELTGEFKAIVFRSRIETQGQILPTAIIIDESVFAIIRTQIVTGIGTGKQEKLIHYINELNAKYTIFKYYLRPDGILFLDVVLPYTDETFDSRMIQLMISILVRHLDETYADMMNMVWTKE